MKKFKIAHLYYDLMNLYGENGNIKALKYAFNSQNVNVIIDSPIGSKHPKRGFLYLTNYGYVPGTMSGDGEELDCYVLGDFAPKKTFTGQCIAVINRYNDITRIFD